MDKTNPDPAYDTPEKLEWGLAQAEYQKALEALVQAEREVENRRRYLAAAKLRVERAAPAVVGTPEPRRRKS